MSSFVVAPVLAQGQEIMSATDGGHRGRHLLHKPGATRMVACGVESRAGAFCNSSSLSR